MTGDKNITALNEVLRLLRIAQDLPAKENLNSMWAVEMLYISNNLEERFISTLEQHLRPIYDSAKMQGYGIWDSANVTGGKI